MSAPNPTGSTDPIWVLRNAALYLERHGWIQDDLYDDWLDTTPAACALGAMQYVVAGQALPEETFWHASSPVFDAQQEAVLRATRAVRRCLVDRGFGNIEDASDYLIASWNDQPGRTASQVCTTLREAAAWQEQHDEVSD